MQAYQFFENCALFSSVIDTFDEAQSTSILPEDDISNQLVPLLANLMHIYCKDQVMIKMIFFSNSYHIGRILKLILKLLEFDNINYSSAVINKCFNDFKQVLEVMQDYALRKLSGK